MASAIRPTLGIGQVGLPALDLDQRLRNHSIDQVVGFDPQAFASRDLDKRALRIVRIGRWRKAQLSRRGMRQRHHLIGEVGEPIGFRWMADGRERLLEQFLQVCLANVDHVVGGGGGAELRMVGNRERRIAGGRPQCLAIDACGEGAVVEIVAQQSGFPELIGHVLADVRHRAIGSDDDLLAVLGVIVALGLRAVRGRLVIDRHHPAAGEAALGLQEDRAGFLEHLESARPELEAQDIAFPSQQLIVDVEAGHRLQVTPHDVVGDERGQAGHRFGAVLDIMQRGRAKLRGAPCRRRTTR